MGGGTCPGAVARRVGVLLVRQGQRAVSAADQAADRLPGAGWRNREQRSLRARRPWTTCRRCWSASTARDRGQPLPGRRRRGDTTHVSSVAKSVVSTLVGIAIADGITDGLDQTVAELPPQERGAMPSAVAAVALRQLMTMSRASSLVRRRDRPEIYASWRRPGGLPARGVPAHVRRQSVRALQYEQSPGRGRVGRCLAARRRRQPQRLW